MAEKWRAISNSLALENQRDTGMFAVLGDVEISRNQRHRTTGLSVRCFGPQLSSSATRVDMLPSFYLYISQISVSSGYVYMICEIKNIVFKWSTAQQKHVLMQLGPDRSSVYSPV